MNCPACDEPLASATERCPACGAMVAPRVEGALAPDPASVTPPARERGGALRGIPALRKRERSWRDEVNERVRHRRQKRAEDAGLPLFQGIDDATPGDEAPTAQAPAPASEDSPAPTVQPRLSGSAPAEGSELGTTHLTDDEIADLPLHSHSVLPPEPEAERLPVVARQTLSSAHSDPPSLDEEPLVSAEDEWPGDISGRATEAPPIERPAQMQERLFAAALDLAVLVGLWGLVVYFAGRAAHAPLVALLPGAGYLGTYLAFLGVFYATYFTGTTGQTPGKMATGLRVVDVGGRPPGYTRACARATLGAAGVLLAGLGLLPMTFDPARRALHDRLLGTRVVKH